MCLVSKLVGLVFVCACYQCALVEATYVKQLISEAYFVRNSKQMWDIVTYNI